jgi:hypothetical protein
VQGGQGEITAGQPVEEVHRGRDTAADVETLQMGGMGSVEASSEPSQVVPVRIGIQDPPLVPVGPGGEGSSGPGRNVSDCAEPERPAKRGRPGRTRTGR